MLHEATPTPTPTAALAKRLLRDGLLPLTAAQLELLAFASRAHDRSGAERLQCAGLSCADDANRLYPTRDNVLTCSTSNDLLPIGEP